jgi:hypothetical protein
VPGLPKKTVAKAVAPKKSAKKSTKKKKAKKTATKASKKAAKKSGAKKTSAGSLGCRKKEGEALRMADTDVPINFDTPAVLKKWPSLKNERISKSWGANAYLVADGTLDECIRQFMSKPASQHHLYEIHTAPQSDLVSAVLSAEHIVELARLRDFL